MKELQIGDSKTSIVSDEDFDRLKNFRWYSSEGYVRTGGGNSIIHASMHEMVLGTAPRGYHIHHINGNKLDNRRENLKILQADTHAAIERRKPGKYIGVFCTGIHSLNCKKPWQAKIKHKCRQILLGYFKTAKEAAKAYDNYVEANGLTRPKNFN